MQKIFYVFVIIWIILTVSFLGQKDNNVCKINIQNKMWIIELAKSPEEHKKWLMWREILCSRCGMLFLFNGAQSRTFWMKDTLIPLNIYFYDEKWDFIDGVQNMLPEKYTQYPMQYTSRPAKYVLEIGNQWEPFSPEFFNPKECL